MADGLTSLGTLSWGTSTGGAAGSAESTLTLGVDRADTRTPPDTSHVWGAQINQVKNLLLLMSATFKGGTRLGVATQSSNPFGASESGFYIDTSGGGWLVFNGTPTAIGGSAATGNWSFSGNTATITGGYTLTGGAASAINTTVGGLTITAAGTVNIQNTSGAVVLGNTSGITSIRGGSTTSVDLSAGNGVFKTTTGAHTFGSASWAVPANTVITGASSATNTTGITLASAVATGASSIGTIINNSVDLTTGKLVSIQSAGTERFAFSWTGTLAVLQAGSAIFSMLANDSTGFQANSGVSYVYNGGTASYAFGAAAFTPQGSQTIGASGTLWPAAWSKRVIQSTQNIAFSATPAFDPTAGNVIHFGPVTGNVTGPTMVSGSPGERCTIVMVKDGTAGAYTVTASWGSNVRTTSSTFTTGAGSLIILNFVWDDRLSTPAWVQMSGLGFN